MKNDHLCLDHTTCSFPGDRRSSASVSSCNSVVEAVKKKAKGNTASRVCDIVRKDCEKRLFDGVQDYNSTYQLLEQGAQGAKHTIEFLVKQMLMCN
jgi:hypothetical protein